MTSALYAALLAMLILGLSINVAKKRRIHAVSYGSGEQADLTRAMAAQETVVEYAPMTLLLLLLLEFNGASLWLVHSLGILVVAGRAVHAHALLADFYALRVVGMQINIYTIASAALANLFYLPYKTLLS